MHYSREKYSLLHRDQRPIALWLAACLLLVVFMVAIGGYTRLSGSGLSITEWKPIHGIIPPLNEQAWQEEFTAYRGTPQYQKINHGMTLAEFQSIYWPEYLHRLLGRTIGLVFFLPFLVFAARKNFTPRLALRLIGIFALGGLQGIIGWVMVKSGLIDQPYVSPLRLALHLITAFALFALLLWTLLDIAASQKDNHLLAANRYPLATYLPYFTLLILQLILGAFMAGLHAGLIYNTWPTMNGAWLPPGLTAPNPLENITLIQFLHRTVAVLVAACFLFWWYLHRNHVKNTHLGKVSAAVTAVITAQFLLGVLTLLHAVPLWLALSHQLVALLLFALSVTLLRGLMKNA